MQEAGPSELLRQFCAEAVWGQEAVIKVGFKSCLCHSLPEGAVGKSIHLSEPQSPWLSHGDSDIPVVELLSGCYRLNVWVPSLNSYVEGLTSKAMSGEVMEVRL